MYKGTEHCCVEFSCRRAGIASGNVRIDGYTLLPGAQDEEIKQVKLRAIAKLTT